MVSSISQYSSMYNLLQSSGASSLYGIGTTSPVTGASAASLYSLGQQEQSYKVKLSGYGQLKSAFDTFQKSLNDLTSSAGVAPYKAASSATSVLTATASKDVTAAGSYSVNVTQLAQAQKLRSGTVADADSTIVGTGSLTIQTGTYNASSNSFTPSSNATTTVTIGTGDGTLSGIANAINKANAGVTASVEQVNGGYQLQLTAKDTGTANSLKITAADTYGNALTANSGLGQLAFNPTANEFSGKNLTETQAARNAQLTVDGTAVTSQSNTVTNGIKGVSLALAATGSSSVKVDVNRDVTAFEASAKKLVEAYNTLQKSVNSLTRYSPQNPSPALPNDRVAGNLASQAQNVVNQASSGYGSNRLNLADIGITRGAEGTLSLNASKLESAFSANPEGAVKLVAETAQKLTTVATQGTGQTSQLQYATQSLQNTVQSLQSNKAVLQNYSSQPSLFGLPADYSLFTYLFSPGSQSGISQYAKISRL